MFSPWERRDDYCPQAQKNSNLRQQAGSESTNGSIFEDRRQPFCRSFDILPL